MTPAERANAAMGWLVASHGWAAGAFDDVVKQIKAAVAEERQACAKLVSDTATALGEHVIPTETEQRRLAYAFAEAELEELAVAILARP